MSSSFLNWFNFPSNLGNNLGNFLFQTSIPFENIKREDMNNIDEKRRRELEENRIKERTNIEVIIIEVIMCIPSPES